MINASLKYPGKHAFSLLQTSEQETLFSWYFSSSENVKNISFFLKSKLQLNGEIISKNQARGQDGDQLATILIRLHIFLSSLSCLKSCWDETYSVMMKTTYIIRPPPSQTNSTKTHQKKFWNKKLVCRVLKMWSFLQITSKGK